MMMQSDTTLKCPKCGAAVPLTESLAAPMVAAVREEMQARVDEAERTARTAKMDADIARADIERDIKFKLDEARTSIEQAAQKTAEAKYGAMFSKQDNEIVGLQESLQAAQQAQAEAVRKERELEGRERAVALTIEQGITQGVSQARDQARREADDAARLRLAEKDTLLHSMEVKVAELQQKLIQGSQQAQGEALELDIEAQLRTRFPRDEFAEVGKGIRGADVTHRVLAPSGVVCGTIIYELKRTKTFSQAWLPKLRSDGREANADVLVLVSQVLPDDVEQFALLDGVWVCRATVLHPLVDALRAGLLSAQAVRQAAEGEATQAEAVYRYLTGSRFKARIEASIEAWTTMQTDLEAERRAMQRQWAKRAAQIDVVIASTTGLFGDLEAVGSMPEIEGLSMKSLGEGA